MKPLLEKSSIDRNDLGQDYINGINDLLLVDPRERLLQEYIIAPLLRHSLPEYDIVPVDDKIGVNIHDYSKYCGKYGKHKKDKENKENLQIKTQTPDLCIAKGWKWNNKDEETEYIATVEIKSPKLNGNYKNNWIAPGYEEVEDTKGNKKLQNIIFKNKAIDIVDDINKKMLNKNKGEYSYDEDDYCNLGIMRQIGIHLRGINKVIVTDGIRWIFFYKDKKGKCKLYTIIDLGKKIFHKKDKIFELVRIEWDIEEYVIKGKKETVVKNFPELIEQIRVFCLNNVQYLEKIRLLMNK